MSLKDVYYTLLTQGTKGVLDGGSTACKASVDSHTFSDCLQIPDTSTNYKFCD
jgi:hypothetical protein